MKVSLKRQFLIYVNLTLFAVLGVLLTIDYGYQKRIHRRELVGGVNRQAKTLEMWLETLPPHDDAAIINVLNKANGIVPPPHVSVSIVLVKKHSGEILAPTSMIRTKAMSLLAAIDNADETLIVGTSRGKVLTVYVVFPESQISEMSASHSLWRLVEMGLLGIVATLLINMLLIRLMLRPFDNVMSTLRRITAGEWGATTDAFQTPELRSLGHEINEMSKALARAKREREMQMAKAVRLQNKLMDQETDVPGLMIDSWHVAAESVAGDYFDVLKTRDGSWLLCLADVTGHGVAAAMEMAILKSLLLTACEQSSDLRTIVCDVNQHFSQVTLEEDFASLLIIRWLPNSKEIEWVNAGHEPAFVLSGDAELSPLNSTGMLIGLNNDEEQWEMGRQKVSSADQIILYTDGITEAQSPDGTVYGRHMFRQVLHSLQELSAVSVIDSIRSTIEEYVGSSAATDDITLVSITID